MSGGGRAPERVRAVDAGVPADQWRRVHPVSPVLNAWKALAALLAVIVYQNADLVADVLSSSWARERGAGVVALIVVAGLIVFLLIAAAYSWLAWRSTSYAVTDEAVWYRSGILFRSQRHARLDRVQSVDMVHPLLGRLFGLGRLSVEVAGGAGSNLSFGYLSTSVLEELRAEILALAAGLRVASQGSEPPGRAAEPSALQGSSPARGAAPSPTAAASSPAAGAQAQARVPVAQERVLYTVAPGRLVASLLLSPGVIAALLAALGFLALAVVLTVVSGPRALSGMAGAVPAVLVAASMVWGRFAGEFNFQAAVSPDGIRIRRGLTETSAQTIPPRRVHAVRIEQPLLWRRRGWYRVTISQAGYAGGDDSQSGSGARGDVLLPVGSREQAELALWLVVRDLGVEDPQAFLADGLEGAGEQASPFVPNSRSSRSLDPWVWRRRAVALTASVLAVRDGRINRRLSVTPVERLQSVGVTQGPLERRLGLADLEMHIVPGGVHAHAHHVDADRARDLAGRLLVLARERRAAEPPEKWMLRVHRAVEDMGEQA
ncbi:PH domain-containing protein [Schaalia naturae]|uniref:PH domain-containing protein n=3 Tax=Schaalia naturae TaxID=635203 RepID=A0ABW2SKG1_9ACTO